MQCANRLITFRSCSDKMQRKPPSVLFLLFLVGCLFARSLFVLVFAVVVVVVLFDFESCFFFNTIY